MNHNAYLYSFANVKESFRPVEWKLIDLATVTVDDIKSLARYMLTKSENVETVILVPPRPNLAHEFQRALKFPTIENCVAFRDYIQRLGIKIV